MNAMALMAQALEKGMPAPAIRTDRKVIPPVTKRVREVAQFVAENPGCARESVAYCFGCAARTAGIHLQAAKLNGLIRCDNRGRFSRWWPV